MFSLSTFMSILVSSIDKKFSWIGVDNWSKLVKGSEVTRKTAAIVAHDRLLYP